ncbi:hypothetical protein [Paenibacillus sp. GP183]|uniref:hypothetical protein n=1 Tax=Paenibacillus sp. GP183 TaxID=1882751 RepID=UPI00089B09F3|nr:hypothetical protein [Paenibacillus sp. GP183]SEC36309.1 hypothetical protein SAMN05443246_3835 [Paenibacillus sp. GP183]
MNPKRIIIVGTMVVAMTLGGSSLSNKVSASSITESHNATTAVKDDLLQILKVSSNEEIYNAIYDGKSLADIANDNQVDVNNVVDLQVAQLTEQLDLRLASGSLTLQQYEAQKSELRDIITSSTYGVS